MFCLGKVQGLPQAAGAALAERVVVSSCVSPIPPTHTHTYTPAAQAHVEWTHRPDSLSALQSNREEPTELGYLAAN